MFVLLTGGTGYIGGHITSQLLEAGHKVRAIVRPGRAEVLHATFPDVGNDKLETVEIAALDKADYTEELKGIEALVHVASPAFLKGETKQVVFEGGYQGTVHIVEAAVQAGVKRIVVTGTGASLFDAGFEAKGDKESTTVGPSDFGNFDLETFDYEQADSVITVYQATKVLAEKRIWQLKDENPEIDFTIILPPTTWGPFVKNSPKPKNVGELSTVGFIHGLIGGNSEYPNLPFAVTADVRDVAKAHILSLTSPPSKKNKRLILASKQFTWKEIADLIREERPDLASRLPSKDAKEPHQMPNKFDDSLTKEMLPGFTYIPWKESILSSLDDALKVEQ